MTDVESLARNARPRPWVFDQSTGMMKGAGGVGTIAEFADPSDAEFVLAAVNGFVVTDGASTPVPDTETVDVDRPLLTPLGHVRNDDGTTRPETPSDRVKLLAELLAWLRANLRASGVHPDWGTAFSKCPPHLAGVFNDTLNTGQGPT